MVRQRLKARNRTIGTTLYLKPHDVKLEGFFNELHSDSSRNFDN